MRSHIRRVADEVTALCGATLWSHAPVPELSDCQRCRAIAGLPKTYRTFQVPEVYQPDAIVVLGLGKGVEVFLDRSWQCCFAVAGRVRTLRFNNQQDAIDKRIEESAGWHLAVLRHKGLLGFLRAKTDVFKDKHFEDRLATRFEHPQTRYDFLMGQDLLPCEV